jgi:acetyl esterase/lipase
MSRLSLILLLLTPPIVRADSPAIRETFDLRYHPGRERHTLDVFAPKTAPKGGLPVVLFVHGGTWMVGDKDFRGTYRGVGRGLARGGVVGVLINYRLSPRVKHPEHTRDVARAFAWVYKNIEKYGGDPKRIILAGHSSGGHLVSLLATDASYLDDKDLKLHAEARKSIRGVVSVCGVYRIPDKQEFRGMVADIVDLYAPSTGKVTALVAPVLRGIGRMANPFAVVFGSDEVKTKASPITHVRAGLPPFLLLNSEAEVPGLFKMAEDFAKALDKKGNKVEHKTVDDVTHRSIVKELHKGDSAASKLVVGFVTKHAGKPAKGDKS